MKKLLFLVHRLPFPPNKGDKISSYNMLRYFSSRWRVHLGTFIDDPEDWQYADIVREYCEDACFVALPTIKKVTGSVAGMLQGQALSVSYYRNEELSNWVKSSCEKESPDAILIYSGAMGQFVSDLSFENIPVVFNAEDVDSEKWRSYASSKPWPLSWLYAREAKKLLEFERAMSKATDFSVFISEAEAKLYQTLAPESADKVRFRTQGVDSNYFQPDDSLENPYESDQKVLVFTGAMDYWPNVEAVVWFCEHVLPKVHSTEPDMLFCIVGMKPVKEVLQLDALPGVRVTGGVPDVRPYLQHAHCACLPLQIARGIQNKALEAMSMELPVVASSKAMTGIEVNSDALVHVSDDAAEMVEMLSKILSLPRGENTAGRACVLETYDWDSNLARLERFLEITKGDA